MVNVVSFGVRRYAERSLVTVSARLLFRSSLISCSLLLGLWYD